MMALGTSDLMISRYDHAYLVFLPTIFKNYIALFTYVGLMSSQMSEEYVWHFCMIFRALWCFSSIFAHYASCACDSSLCEYVGQALGGYEFVPGHGGHGFKVGVAKI